MLKSTAILMLACTAALGASASYADTDTTWQKHHPRREQVNERLAHQDKRINQERREGDITKQQAHRLHREDHQVRAEERAMASQNGGHITKLEQRALNQQENKISGEIGK